MGRVLDGERSGTRTTTIARGARAYRVDNWETGSRHSIGWARRRCSAAYSRASNFCWKGLMLLCRACSSWCAWKGLWSRKRRIDDKRGGGVGICRHHVLRAVSMTMPLRRHEIKSALLSLVRISSAAFGVAFCCFISGVCLFCLIRPLCTWLKVKCVCNGSLFYPNRPC